ncbi:unnamed protein product [Thelazia callipaeda]|uniref:Glutaredoxin domain-containing protein n=1 Tax=Thelazia callipaeda TaxID=103827 RepID=A0A0N5DBW2_THECL|nr:unnamed protein product [Thelazia callipaeda]
MTEQVKSNLLEETQFINPKSFDYAFDDDLRKTVDRNDIYDELVPFLPSFIVFKNGKEAGRTNVPIVTRKVPTWSTPSPREKYMEPYKPSSSKSLAIVRRLTSRDRTLVFPIKTCSD